MRLSKLIRYFEADGTPTDEGIRDIAHRRSITSGGGALPAGGTAGQILVKQSAADGDADWENFVIDGGGA